MNSVKYLAIILSAMLVASCGVGTKKPAPSVSAESVIAQDFVNTMIQIDALMPWSTVLHFNADDTSHLKTASPSERTTRNFGRALRVAATNSGYALQTVDGVRGSNFVRFSVSETNDQEAGLAYTYDVSIGDIDFRRAYLPLDNGLVKPYKSMLVRGADVSNVKQDDTIFPQHPGGETAAPLMAQNELAKPAAPVAPARDGFDSPFARNDEMRRRESELLREDVAVTSPTSDLPKVVRQPDSNSTLASTQPQTSQTERLDISNVEPDTTYLESSGFSIVSKRNIAESGTSNFDSLLATKLNVAEEILIFGDDSYVLGARNKKILGEVMNSFDPETDVISVVGCSTGTTKIANGNAALAIGRANRVKEALLYSGIPHDKIFDEGCWSPTANSTPFPNRGVVITVKRDVKKG